MKRLTIVIAITLLIPKLSQCGDNSEGIHRLNKSHFTVIIGTTWYETQHHGTVGRMAEFDEDGNLHFAWMNGLNYGAMDRHVFYNYMDQYGNQGWPGTGYPVESSYRGGFVTLDAGYGG